MQNSELFRRGIVLPRSEFAKIALLSNNVDDSTEVVSVEIEHDALFYEIWDIGVFQEINRRTGLNIDDYEEEVIPPNLLPQTLQAISIAVLTTSVGSPTREFLVRAEEVCREGIRISMPLYFVF